MAKRKGSSSSGPSKVAKKGNETKTSDKGVNDTFRQLTRETRVLDGKLAELSEKESKLENKKRKLEDQRRELEKNEHKVEELKRDAEEQLRSLRREVEQVQQDRLPTRNLLKDVCSAREVENAHPLGKLPPEVWEKILANLGENDLFPLALSCRYFRQKQKELVARARQNKAPPPTLKTTLKANFAPDLVRKHRETLPASAEYLKFCMKEEEFRNRKKAGCLQYLAVLHGHLPLLQDQDFLDPDEIHRGITKVAGESSPSQSLLLLCFSF